METALTARMTSDATLLLDRQQDCVVVAIESQVFHDLHMARLLAFAPELGARARPVYGTAFLHRRRQRFAIHPGEHQDFTGRRLLRDRRHQSVRVPVHCIKPIGSHETLFHRIGAKSTKRTRRKTYDRRKNVERSHDFAPKTMSAAEPDRRQRWQLVTK